MIDTSDFRYGDSVWADVFNHLKGMGFDVYPPQVKIGECDSPYVVVKLGSTSQLEDFSSDRVIYELLVYVPRQSYSYLEPYVESVKDAMRELRPLVRYSHGITASFYDDTLKAHMVTLDYYNYRKS